MSNPAKTYLGDGLYAHDEAYMTVLSTERDGGEHYVCLEPEVFQEFLKFMAKQRGLKITVQNLDDPKQVWETR